MVDMYKSGLTKNTQDDGARVLSRIKSHRFFQKIGFIAPKAIVLLSFIVPMLILYALDPNSFFLTWKGRTFYLFFVWLVFLEIIISWEDLPLKPKRVSIPWVVTLGITMSIPTIYVIAANCFGLNNMIWDFAKQLNVPLSDLMPLSIEYLAFTGMSAGILLAMFGLEGLRSLSISVIFLGAIGTIYTIDNLFPYGYFTPFQIFVPTTTALAAFVLAFLGYQTTLGWSSQFQATTLHVRNSLGQGVGFAVGWPCAGVQSLIIFSFVLLIFFKKTSIPQVHRVGYFIIGAFITYLVNIFRIVSIYLVYFNNIGYGSDAAWQAAMTFHDYYGGLYSMTWILAYPMIIIGTRIFWAHVKNRKAKLGLFHHFNEHSA
jgi:thaumarchaeosortase